MDRLLIVSIDLKMAIFCLRGNERCILRDWAPEIQRAPAVLLAKRVRMTSWSTIVSQVQQRSRYSKVGTKEKKTYPSWYSVSGHYVQPSSSNEILFTESVDIRSSSSSLLCIRK